MCAAAASKASASGHPRLLLDPRTLAALRARAARDSPQWRVLRPICNALVAEQVVLANATPSGSQLGEGYQGSDYFDAVADLGLCYQLTRHANPGLAASYAAKGQQVLVAMSVPAGAPGTVDPLRDSGYGIRNYGVGMALGYDWLHDALALGILARVQSALLRWITAFEQRGFGYVLSSPNGNYFAGYFAAKGFAAMGLDGAVATRLWGDFYRRVTTVVTDLRPRAKYALSRSTSGGGVLVALAQSATGSLRADSSGTLSFTS